MNLFAYEGKWQDKKGKQKEIEKTFDFKKPNNKHRIEERQEKLTEQVSAEW